MDKEMTIELLHQLYPTEASMVGTTLLEHIVEGTKFDDAEGGSFLDFSEVLTILAN